MRDCKKSIFEVFAARVVRAKDSHEVAASLAQLSFTYGLCTVTIAEANTFGNADPSINIIAEFLPTKWPRFLTRRWLGRYGAIDWTTLAHGSKSVFLPQQASNKISSKEKEEFASADALVLTEFLLVPVPQCDGRIGIVSFGGRQRCRDKTTTSVLEAAATIAFRRCRLIAGYEQKRLLTHRQQEVCGLLAVGKTSEEIGEILNISKATVELHIRHSKERLGTATRVSTVLEAMRRGQLLNGLSKSDHFG